MELKFSLPKPQMQVYHWAKLLALAPFSLKNNMICPATLQGKLYSVTFAATYLLLVLTPFLTMAGPVQENSSPFTSIGSALHYVLNGAATFFTLIVFLLKSEDIVSLMNKLCSVGDQLKSLDIEEDLGKLFNNIFVTTLAGNLFIGTTCLAAGLLEPFWPAYVSFAFGVGECLRLNTILVFAQTLLCIGQRFTLVNKKLYDVCQLPRDVPSPVKLGKLVASKSQTESKRENQMWMVEALHVELCELVDLTTRLFATPIFLNILALCCELLVPSSWTHLIAPNGRHPDAEQHLWFDNVQILYPLLRMAIVTIELVIIAYAAGTTCYQGNAIKIVLFRVWSKFAPTDLRNEFLMFSLHLLHQPVTVTAFGFFDLGYSCLFKIFFAVLAYFTIIVQMNTSQPNHGT